ncbi:MAG: RNA 2',3'-cyclic phosphodiesterase [Candidatus Omnitrophota bacterium]
MSDATTRAFIAISLTRQLHDELSILQDKLKQSNADVKWSEPENIHLTLKFLGNITDEQIKNVVLSLKKISSGFNAFSVHLAQVGAFPKTSYPRVIWVGMDEGAETVKRLNQSIENELEALGLRKETREFSCHLTLGRVRSVKNKQGLTNIIEKEKDFTSAYRVLIEDIILFKSTLTKKGPIYEPIFKGSLIKT